MTELILTIVSGLVGNKDAIEIKEIESNEDGIIVYQVSVADEDKGRVIGKNGKTAKSIRTIVRSVAVKQGIKVTVDIV